MKNYCDYDSIIHYDPGEFATKYKTDLDGKIEEVERDCTLTKTDVESFLNGYYKTCIT